MPEGPLRLRRAVRKRPVAVMLMLAALAVVFRVLFEYVLAMQQFALQQDWPWLYRTGQFIWLHTHLPTTDLYSWTFPDRHWIVYQWLFEMLFGGAATLIEPQALVALFGLLALLIYIAVPYIWLRRRGVTFGLGFVVPVILLLPVVYNLSLRPMLATSAFLLLQYMLVFTMRRRQRVNWMSLAALVVMYIVWANTHMGFVLGLLSLVLFVSGDVLERLHLYRYRPVGPVTSGMPMPVGIYAGLLVIALVSSLVNPYGINVYGYLLHLSLKTDLSNAILELRPPDPTEPQLLVAGVLFLLFCVSLWRARTRYAAFEILHVAVFAVLTLIAVRFIVWYGLFAALILPIGFQRTFHDAAYLFGNVHLALRWLQRWHMSILTTWWGGAVLLFVVAPGWVQPLAFNRCDDVLPALRVWHAHYKPGDRWFSDETVGSCSLLVDMRVPVFIDSRLDFYPEDFVLTVYRTLRAEQDWHPLFRRWDIEYALISRSWPLARRLMDSGDFERIYADDNAILLRRQPSSQPQDRE